MNIVNNKLVNLGLIIFLGISVLLGSASVFAQEYPDQWLEPEFGTAELDTGFTPDPYELEFVAGGQLGLGDLGFVGYVAESPDYDLIYEAGDEYPLVIKAELDDSYFDGEIFLLVNTPDEKWYYDWHDDREPIIQFDNPQSGYYNIWVGTLSGGYPEVKLSISEYETSKVTAFDLSEEAGNPLNGDDVKLD
ncbi:MAG: peptidase S1 [Halarsenatibacteraceae bacterium]